MVGIILRGKKCYTRYYLKDCIKTFLSCNNVVNGYVDVKEGVVGLEDSITKEIHIFNIFKRVLEMIKSIQAVVLLSFILSS